MLLLGQPPPKAFITAASMRPKALAMAWGEQAVGAVVMLMDYIMCYYGGCVKGSKSASVPILNWGVLRGKTPSNIGNTVIHDG